MKNPSLQNVNQSVNTENKKSWKKIFAFFGPAYLIAVGYMDPGNWATDLAAGSKYGYTLIWVLLMSNIMALLLQSLSSRLGIVRGVDLAQANREYYPKWVNYILYAFAEIAIAATDLAEVLGMAIGIQLLFGLDLIWGVGITVLDTLLLIVLERYGIRKMEAFIIGLISIIGLSFLGELIMSKPDLIEVSKGFIPSIPDNTALYIAIGIIGATVMPHNLYLHSSLVQTRKIKRNSASIKQALRFNFWDSFIALNIAFLVNAAILILAASAFHKAGHFEIAGLKEAHNLLSSVLGSSIAPILFAVALIAAGQSSTVTGTLAGQIVMEGYLHLRINPILRRLITRLIAIIPAVIIIYSFGEKLADEMLVFSQVLLSMQLGFAVIPLIHFVSDKSKMGNFTIKWYIKIFSWFICTVIVYLNIKLVYDEAMLIYSGTKNISVKFFVIALSLFLLLSLLFVLLYPLFVKSKQLKFNLHDLPVSHHKQENYLRPFNKIGITLDFSGADNRVLTYLKSIANKESHIFLFHITQSAAAIYSGKMADDYEVKFDQQRLEHYQQSLQNEGFKVEVFLGYGKPTVEIPKLANQNNVDVLLMAKHGHKGISDVIFGTTTNQVIHQAKMPVLVV